jgi:Pentapeptide repeats (8 copies)
MRQASSSDCPIYPRSGRLPLTSLTPFDYNRRPARGVRRAARRTGWQVNPRRPGGTGGVVLLFVDKSSGAVACEPLRRWPEPRDGKQRGSRPYTGGSCRLERVAGANPGHRVDLWGRTCAGAKLPRANLEGADLRSANLHSAKILSSSFGLPSPPTTLIMEPHRGGPRVGEARGGRPARRDPHRGEPPRGGSQRGGSTRPWSGRT